MENEADEAIPQRNLEPTHSLEPSGPSSRLFSAFASALLPGLGQWLLGSKRKALVYLAWLLVLCLCYWPMRLPRWYAGLIFLVWSSLALGVTASWSALRGYSVKASPGSRWWLLLLIPASIVSTAIYGRALIRITGFRNYQVPSVSMETTIPVNSYLMADHRAYRGIAPAPFDIVLVQKERNVIVSKRVIAVAGSTIEMRSGKVWVNGKTLQEPYLNADCEENPEHPEMTNFGPITVPANTLFVMGDNRNMSYDSRIYGPVDVKDIEGRVMYLYRTGREYRVKDLR